jgi:hypothetical protein
MILHANNRFFFKKRNINMNYFTFHSKFLTFAANIVHIYKWNKNLN